MSPVNPKTDFGDSLDNRSEERRVGKEFRTWWGEGH